MSISIYFEQLKKRKKQEKWERFLKESKWDFLTSLWLVGVLLTMLLLGRFTV